MSKAKGKRMSFRSLDASFVVILHIDASATSMPHFVPEFSGPPESSWGERIEDNKTINVTLSRFLSVTRSRTPSQQIHI